MDILPERLPSIITGCLFGFIICITLLILLIRRLIKGEGECPEVFAILFLGVGAIAFFIIMCCDIKDLNHWNYLKEYNPPAYELKRTEVVTHEEKVARELNEKEEAEREAERLEKSQREAEQFIYDMERRRQDEKERRLEELERNYQRNKGKY